MQLIYCYIKRFRNIVEQDVCFTHDFDVRYRDSHLFISPKAGTHVQSVKDYFYGESMLKNLTVIVGKTGSGKTNLLQLIGMDYFNRSDEEKGSAYLMLYKTSEDDSFMCEIVGMEIIGINEALQKRTSRPRSQSCRFKYDFERQIISNVNVVTRNEHEETYIVNTFDRHAFAHCPYPDERDDTDKEGFGEFVFRKISPYGRDSVSMECLYLKDYLSGFAENSIKRQAAFVISRENWQGVLKNKIPAKALKQHYWTFKERAEEQRIENMRKGISDKSPEYPLFLTPKRRFLHDLMMDFAIYLRKWADCIEHVDEHGYFQYAGIKTPAVLPDKEKMSVLKRINWLCQYIDYNSDDEFGNKGLVWQIGDDIKDIFTELSKMPEEYFTEDEFRIPVMEIDLSEKSPMSELFERMDQYYPDELGIFRSELLPYHWSGVSSGEYQYAKVWGVFYEYASKVRMGRPAESYEKSVVPNIIVLMDEPESFMHPEMCRRFIHKMGEILRHGDSKRNVQIIMSTHSPFMLSDVLAEQIVRMDVDEQGLCHIMQNSERTYFAASIHSIMADGFFFDYTIGEEARTFLSEKFNWLKGLIGKPLGHEERSEVERMGTMIPMIGDDIIRYSFKNLIRLLS